MSSGYQPISAVALGKQPKLAGGAPLRERMTLVWHDLFATSNDKVDDVRLMHAQNELFRTQGLGDFRALLHALARDPAMLVWLDGDSNRRGHANENFAREVLELFALGIGNYGERDIQEAARAFSGWGTEGRASVFRAAHHDDGEKTLFAQTGRWSSDDALDLILAQPACARHVARVLLGIDPAANPGAGMIETGAGQVVGVADTGLDQTHLDFQGRIAGVSALGRSNDATDPHGHGTHVAGSVLGSGAASNQKYRGAAPAARLFFQSLLDSNGKLGGLPLDLNDLFDEAYQQNARIHNNSWGSAVGAEYTLNSQEVDEFVANKRDMLIVVSAGNEGQCATRVNSKIGMVDWLSIGAPASSKNALTVGASRSNRTAGGYSTITYGAAWPGSFPDNPIAKETVSGSPDGIAGFSSRGPCTDRRVKPDVMAPGTDILSAKSKLASLVKFWGPGPQPEYAYMGGTSMAAPLVAGCAALVREYFITTRGHANPSAALLKATLINSTKKLPGADAVADFDIVPNMHQGFGVIHMPFAYPNPVNPALRLEFVDDWQTAAASFAGTGDRRRYEITVAAGTRFSICLVWTDAPGRALQNNLNLLVETPAAQKVAGNEKLPMALGPVDQENNVEIVRFDAPAAGKYRIQISASNLLTASQDFALVVTGALTSPLTPV